VTRESSPGRFTETSARRRGGSTRWRAPAHPPSTVVPFPSDKRSGSLSLFWELHSDLPREGPGSDRSTREAAEKLPRLSDDARVLDVGCGPGAQTLALARAFPQAHIMAVDRHAPFLKDLTRRTRSSEAFSRIASLQGDMRALPFSDNRFDLIWSEGAIYIVGFEAGLRSWRPLLKTHGCVAVTEISWLTEAPPEAPTQFWSRNYPAMATIAWGGHASAPRACLFGVRSHITTLNVGDRRLASSENVVM